MRSILAAVLVMMSCSALAEEIAVCRNPSGKTFWHFVGPVDQKSAGWTDDKITGGAFTLSQLADGSFDILYVDSRNKPTSSVQDGAVIRLLRWDATTLTLLVFYESAMTEIYTFFRDKAGKSQFTMLQNRTGSGAPVSKSSLLVGDCDPINFGVTRVPAAR